MSTTVPSQVIVENGTPKPLGEVLTEQSTALASTISTTSIGAKGDLLVGSGPGALLVLPIGVDGQVLTADSTQSYGMLWKPSANTFANGLTVSGGVATFNTGLVVPASNIITANGITSFTNTALTLKGNGTSGFAPVVIIDTLGNAASNNILSLRDLGVEKAFVDASGAIYASTFGSSNTNGGVTIFGTQTGASGVTTVTIRSLYNLTAGAIVDFLNGTYIKSRIGLDGSFVGVFGPAILGTDAVISSGTMVSFRNGGTEKASFDYAGILYVPEIDAVSGASPLFLKGRTADSATAVGLVLDNTTNLVTAGAKLLSIRNAGVEKAYIDKDGNPTFGGGTGTVTATLLAPSGGVARVRGNFLDGPTAVGVILDNNATLVTAGSKLVSIRNNTVEKAWIDSNGGYGIPGGGSILSNTLSTYGATSLTLTGNVADSATAVGLILNNSVNLVTSGAKLASFRNAGVEKAYININGDYVSPNGSVLAVNFAPPIAASTIIKGAIADGATAIGNKIGNSNALVTSGAKIASFYSDNLVTEVAYVRQDGYMYGTGYLAPSTIYAASYGPYSSTAGMNIFGRIPDGATAIANKIGNVNALATAGAKIVSFYSDNLVTERAYITKDGILGGPGASIAGSSGNTMPRPAISATPLAQGEIWGRNTGSLTNDDGFLRVSAGGGTNATQKTYIDLSGYSTVADMTRNIVLGTDGVERARIDSTGITLPLGEGISLNGPGSAKLSGTSVGDVVATNEIRGVTLGASSGLFYASGANPAVLRGNQNDSVTAVGTILNSNVNLVTAGAKLLSVRNANTEKAYVDLNGNVFSGGTVSAIGTSSLTIRGQNADSATAVGVISDTSATYTAGTGARLMSVRNNGTEKLWIDPAGTITSSGNITSGGSFLPTGANPITIKGTVADGATAIANKIGSNTALATAGAKITSFYSDNFTTEKLAIDLNGKFISPTGTAADTVGKKALVAGTATVATTAVTANSIILLTRQVAAGTTGDLRVGTITAGTSFVINSASSTDTSTVSWMITN